MCDDKCAPNPQDYRCEPCRTINLARIKEQKPDMQVFGKCASAGGVYLPVSEMKIKPICIRVCDKDDLMKRHSGRTCIPQPMVRSPGLVMQIVKAGVLVGVVYFTYAQGVWGDQQQTRECLNRWSAYMRSFTTRRPPEFDADGKVIVKDVDCGDGLIPPLYAAYKNMITTCFAGVVKFPTVVKCMYVELQRRQQQLEEAKNKDREAAKKKAV